MVRSSQCESGARNVDNILTNTLLPDISRMLLAEMVEGGRPQRIRVTIDAGGDFEYGMDTPEEIDLQVPVATS